MGFDNRDLLALFCALAAVPVGAFVTNMLVEWAWKNVKDPVDRPERHHRPITFMLGLVEIFLYLVALLVRVPEFVVVWLLVKTAGRWQGVATQPSGRTVWNIFLIGSGLTLIFALLGWIAWVMIAHNPFPLALG